jgi:hypothetical protein
MGGRSEIYFRTRDGFRTSRDALGWAEPLLPQRETQFDTIERHSYPGLFARAGFPAARSLMKFPLLAMAAVAALIPACVPINGGAVEISWLVVSSPGGGVITDCACADPAIAKVRLVLVGVGGALDGATPCAGKAQCDFPCQNQTGATQFDIPATGPGESYEVSVVAVGTDGNAISQGQIMTPAPILRQVTGGQPTEVEAFTLVAPCAQSCSGNVCAPP